MDPKFENFLNEAISSYFNINLFGPSGCGKTTLLTKIFKHRQDYFEAHLLLNLSDFSMKKYLFEKISKFFNSFFESKSKNISRNCVNCIHKWYDLYELLEECNNLSYKIYFIIDDILDFDSFCYFKKELIKFLVCISTSKNMRVILVSNFDITNSELQYDFDFSNFTSIQFPDLTKEKIRQIIDAKFHDGYYDEKYYDEIVNSCIQNFTYNFQNLNEFIYNIRENLNLFNYKTVTGKVTQFIRKVQYTHVKKSESEKKSEKNSEKISQNKKYQNKNNLNDNEEKNLNNKIEEEEYHTNIQNQDIYTFNSTINDHKEEYNSSILIQNIRNQISYAPIHIVKLDNFLEGREIYEDNNDNNIKESENENVNEPNNSGNNVKKIEDSLSESQKILLLASYLANETSMKYDRYLFKEKKNNSLNKNKGKNKNNNIAFKLKSNIGYAFTAHRLIAIYQSLCSIIYHDDKHDKKNDIVDDDIMLKCEILTLIKLELLRKAGRNNMSLDQKYLSAINLETASKIAEEYDIHLDEFIKYDKMD